MPAPHETRDYLKYRPDIDGLRAIAVFSVILFHLDLPIVSGGYVGVDIFFVISGYLITNIIYRDILAGKFSIARFYERRARRILPALFVMMTAVLVYTAVYLLPSDLERVGNEAIASTLFAANFFYWHVTDYFAQGADARLLLHTWSLSVEEQFYLAFPLFLATLYRLSPKHLCLAVALALAGSWALCVGLTPVKPMASFYLPLTRAWELLLGALLALGFFPAARSAAPAAGIVGLVFIAGSLVLFDGDTSFPGIAASVPVIGAALMIWAGSTPNLASRLLASRPLVFAGLISYSLYLWHWPLILIARRWIERDLMGAEVAVYLFAIVRLSARRWHVIAEGLQGAM